MTLAFDETTRQRIKQRCAAFSRTAAPTFESTLKQAAVAIALVAGDVPGEAAFVLTLRAASLRAHSSQWALPGGRCDAGEAAAEGALRELREEVGLSLGKGDVLGLLDDYPTRSGYLITPVVMWASADARLEPNPDEVASVHRIALVDIARTDAFDFVRIPESDRRVIRFRHRGQLIHAPTAAMIYQFREMLAGRDTRVADLEQPVFAWK